MSSRWANPVNNNILRDKENNVLKGGKLKFFTADTSSPLAVFSDPELTVSLGSEVVADAFGLIPDFHLAAGTQYKVVAEDSLAAEKWTRDFVFSLDTSIDSRLDALEDSINNSAASRNLLVNGGMRVDDGTDATLSAAFQEGKVNTLLGLVANVTAGTLTQAASTTYKSGKYAAFSAVSTSGAGVVEAQIRVPSDTVAQIVDSSAVFSTTVRHDVGSNVTYTIKFLIPTGAADDFSSLSTIFTGSGDVVATGTDTKIELSTADIGDVSKGLAIEISAAVGTLSGREFRVTEAQFEPGSVSTAFTESIFETAEASISWRDRSLHTGTQPLATISDSGALAALNSVNQATIDAAGVGQSELKTSSGLVTNAGAGGNFLLPGGQYGFFPQVANIVAAASLIDVMNNTSVFTVVRANLGLGSNTQALQRYVTASPPYNLGDGDIASFTFVKLGADNKILGVYTADTPPWVYNGPTSICPDAVESNGFGGLTKKKWVTCTKSCPKHPMDGGDPAEYAEFIANPIKSLVEIDNDMKNADMSLIPHPFTDLADGERVALIDPCGKINDHLAMMHDAGDNIAQLLLAGHLLIGDEVQDCCKPDGVSVVLAKWKVTK